MLQIQLSRPNWLFYFGSIFPFASVIAGWCIYYGYGHHTPGCLRTISETVIPFPENRIFSTTMNVECLVLILIFLLRRKIIQAAAERKNVSSNFKYKVLRFVSDFLTPLCISGLSLTSAFTLIDYKILHLLAASFFFFGVLIYYIITDKMAIMAGIKINWFSRLLPYVAIVIIFTYNTIMVKQFTNFDPKTYSFCSACQYVSCFMIFLKIFLMRFDLPEFEFCSKKKTQ